MLSPTFRTKLENAFGSLRALRELIDGPGDLLYHVNLVRKKLPALREGLKTIGKSDKTEVLSIGKMIDDNARARPDAPALYYADQTFTHRQLNERSNQYANFLWSRGIRKGDAVAIFVENRPDILFAVAGAVKIGAIAAVINTNQRKHVLTHSFSLCNAKFYVVGEELWDAFVEVREDIANDGAEQVLFVSDSGERPAPADATPPSALDEADTSTPSALGEVTLGDPCFYIYTSGTTGLPKASIMSHFRWIKAAAAFGKLALNIEPDDIVYVPLPLYHNNALTVTWASATSAGAAMVIRRKFSASKFWDDVRRYRATVFCYIGELCRYLMNQPPASDDRDNPVKKIIGNGLRPDIWRGFKERFGIEEVYEFYAASEGNVAFVNVFNFDCTVGFCPAPYELVEYDVDADEPVRDANGHLIKVKPGGVGLLIAEVSEKYAFDGYTDKQASEKKLLRDVFKPGDCYFNSGDLLRDQGFRHAQFVDRVGDTFRWKSENVSTNEVAEVLNTHDHVKEATVYGVQIPGTEGRAGMAAIVPAVKLEEFDFAGFARHIASELPSYAVPVFLRFRPELEVTGTFKQVKGDLKKQGYDPAAGGDPTYVMLPKTGEYVEVTADIVRQIDAQELRF